MDVPFRPPAWMARTILVPFTLMTNWVMMVSSAMVSLVRVAFVLLPLSHAHELLRHRHHIITTHVSCARINTFCCRCWCRECEGEGGERREQLLLLLPWAASVLEERVLEKRESARYARERARERSCCCFCCDVSAWEEQRRWRWPNTTINCGWA